MWEILDRETGTKYSDYDGDNPYHFLLIDEVAYNPETKEVRYWGR